MNCMYAILVVIALSNSCFAAVLPKAGCSISINRHLSDPQPLLLLQNGAVSSSDAFPLPVDDYGTLTFSTGEKIDLACVGGSVVVGGSSTGQSLVEAECDAGVNFLVQSKSVAFNTITCTVDTYHTSRYTGNTCSSQYREIEIGFNVNNRFIRHIITCFDDDLQTVVYSQFNLTYTIGGFQTGYPRPSFEIGDFFNVGTTSLHSIYSRYIQRITINNILGLSESDTSIIHGTNDFYLARGHYTAKADFLYGSQHRLTFYYVNVAPQWQIFNDGNWNTLEGNCRDFASNRGLDLVVYTGSHGIATLPDKNGKEQELYLYVRGATKGIPVPALFYKVLYEPTTKAGIAFIGLNNPYKEDITGEIICENVCDQVNWLSWKRENITLGYSYCCDVNEFREKVTVLPSFDVNSLLV